MKNIDINARYAGALQSAQNEGLTGCVSIWLMNRLRSEKGDWSKIFLTSGTRGIEGSLESGYENN